MSVQGEQVVYRGIRQILDEMIYNICENAIKYNNEEMCIRDSVQYRCEEECEDRGDHASVV